MVHLFHLIYPQAHQGITCQLLGGHIRWKRGTMSAL